MATAPASSPPILLSVVTPSFNQARFLRHNIESVLGQGVAGVEHIVMDGGSTDGSVEILKAYPHLTWASERDSGQSEALNKAIARARGEWIVWVNSDDFLLPGALRKFLEFVAAHPDARFVYSNCTFVDEEGRPVGRRDASYSRERGTVEHWWRAGGAGFAQPGSLFRKSLWEEFGPFDESLHYAMDYDFWLKMRGRVEFLHLDDDLAAYRLHGEAKTSEGWRPFAQERLRIMRRYWGAQGIWPRLKYAALAQAMLSTQMLSEGARAWRRGERWRAARCWAEAVARNPFCFLSPSNWRYFLRGSRDAQDASGWRIGNAGASLAAANSPPSLAPGPVMNHEPPIRRSGSESRNPEPEIRRSGSAVRNPESAPPRTQSATRSPQSAMISVVLPAWNAEATLARALRSVLAQEHPNLEVLVVDDGSTDGTRSVADGFGSPVRCLTGAHAGASAARNLAVAQARGEFVAFLDADDEWLPGYLGAMLRPMLDAADVGMTFCRAWRRLPDGREEVFGLAFQRRRVFPEHLWPSALQVTSATVCRASALRAAGTFDEALASREDLDVWIRIAERARVIEVARTLVRKHVRDPRAETAGRDWARIGREYFTVLERALARRPDLYGPHERIIRADADWHWGLMALKSGDCAAARPALWRSLASAPRLGTVPPALLALLPSWLVARVTSRRG